MKKLTATILAFAVFLTSIFASAAVPEFLSQTYTNYSSDYTISMSFNSSDDIVSLLKELKIPEEINYYIDLKAFLTTLLSNKSKVKLQADIGDNYKKMRLALTSEASQNIIFNNNFNVDMNSKTGMWIDIDLSDKEHPLFDVIYSAPFTNKYIKINAGEVLDDEALKIFDLVYNKSFIDTINKSSVELFAKHATITGSGVRYTVKMDNKGLIAYINELIPVITQVTNLILNNTGEEYEDLFVDFSLPDNLQILGKNGINNVYNLRGKYITTQKTTADFLIDISNIYTIITGEEWSYKASGIIDFTLDMSANISKIGTTKPEFPVLTDENSITMDTLAPDRIPEAEYGEESYSDYPHWYVSGISEKLPIVNDEFYVPLRQTLEMAYEDNITIDYKNGVIKAKSEYFNEFDEITITINSDKVSTDSTEHLMAKPILIDGTTYVNTKLFTELFGWSFDEAQYNYLSKEYFYAFSTFDF